MSSKMRVQQTQPVMHIRASNEWSSGICDCFEELPECCLAFWCLPCFACITSKKFGECLCLPLLDFGPIPAISMSMRVAMRQRYGIRGDMCHDCLYSFFCMPCNWCQMSREMKRRQLDVVLVNSYPK